MDEEFHMPQTQAYCAGRWAQWDSKITTFPGLYITAVPFAHAVQQIGQAVGVSGTAASTAGASALNDPPPLPAGAEPAGKAANSLRACARPDSAAATSA